MRDASRDDLRATTYTSCALRSKFRPQRFAHRGVA